MAGEGGGATDLQLVEEAAEAAIVDFREPVDDRSPRRLGGLVRRPRRRRTSSNPSRRRSAPARAHHGLVRGRRRWHRGAARCLARNPSLPGLPLLGNPGNTLTDATPSCANCLEPGFQRAGLRAMPRYAEFGQNTFVGSPAQAQAHVSSPTAGGLFSVFAWFDFDEGGGAVFELRLSVLGGIRDVLRRGTCASGQRPAPCSARLRCPRGRALLTACARDPGPSLMAVAGDGPALLEWRQAHSGREGVRFARCSLLDAVMLVCETVALLDEEEQKAMEVKPWYALALAQTQRADDRVELPQRE